MDHLIRNLWDDFELISGGGRLMERGVCVMQAVAYVAGEGDENVTTDHPQCVSPALTEAFINMNDLFTPEQRKLLRPFIPRLIGTRMHNTMDATEKALFDYAKVDYAKLLFDRLGREIDEKLEWLREKEGGPVRVGYLLDFEQAREKWTAMSLLYATSLYLELLAIEQGLNERDHKTSSGTSVYSDEYDASELDISAFLEHIDQVLPPAKPYTIFNGKKVNIMERTHKMINFWRKKKGIKTEWPHEEGLVVDAA